MAAVAACSFFTLSSVQAVASEAKQCWHPYEVEAAKVRDLHVMLMLGALRCKAANKDMMGKYEAFTASKSGLLNSYNNVLKTRFMRVNGISDAQRAYEAFNTRLGNSHSGLVQATSYCAMTDTLLTLAASASDRELPQLATNFSESALGIDALCEPPAVAVTAPATAAPHEAITATQAAPATVAVAKPEEAVTEPVSAAAALEAAAVALQNAAASLKAQPAAPEPATESADKPVTAAPEASPAVPQPVTAKAAPTG
jgi:hypothetical protein